MSRVLTTSWTILVLTVSTLSFGGAGALAGGFHLVEYSGSGMGRAYSGEAAIGDDASIVSANPAGMSLLKSSQFVGMVAYVKPAGEMFVERSSIDLEMSLLSVKSKASAQVQGSQTGSGFGGGSFMPTLYYVQPLNERFHWGLGAFSRFGLMQDYNDDFVGRFLLNEIQVLTFNLNVSASYRWNKHWSFGAGVNAVMAQSSMDQFLPDVLALGGDLFRDVASALPGIDSDALNEDPESLNGGRLQLKGTQTVFVPNFGVLYNWSRRTRFGFAYNPGYELNLKGEATFRDCSSANSAILGAFTDICGSGFDSRLVVDIPATAEFSAYHRLSAKIALHGDVKYTQWSQAGQMKILNDSAETPEDQMFYDASHQYRDTFRYAVGLTYHYSGKTILRAGAAYDQGFAEEDDYSLNGSDTNRYVVGVGGRHQFSKALSVDVGYLHYFFERYEVNESLGLANYNLGPLAMDASYNLQGNGIMSLDMLSVQLNWTY